MEFLAEYGLFLAKAVTFLLVVAGVLVVVSALGGQKSHANQGQIEVEHLNERFDQMRQHLRDAVLDKDELKQLAKQEKKAAKERASEPDRKRVYVIDFDGDIKASQVASLREEISAVLTMARPQDEVLVRLESAGGMVHGYGLAASQLARLREREIPLTIAVDKVAASGGYMMACLGNQILAAPFAILGSIGVVAQIPNFHRLLEKNDVDVELLTAGEYKRTLTMFGQNTDKGRQKFLQDLEETHQLFKSFVAEQRPVVDIEKVATGEIWYGQQAVAEQLIDRVMTSDQYLQGQADNAELYRVEYCMKKGLVEKLGLSIEAGVGRGFNSLLSRVQASRFIS